MNSPFPSRPALWLLLALCVAGLYAAPAGAQGKIEPSTGEDVAIAFFKTAETKPDFTRLARGGKEFKSVAPALAEDYIARERQRLIGLWKAYDPATGMIDVTAPVTIVLKHYADSEKAERFKMTMAFGTGDVTYFPFVYQDYKIAVIPQKIESVLVQPLTREQFTLISGHFKDGLTGRGTLDLQLKPIKAYIQQPYMVDNVEQWMMLTDPVTLTLRTEQGTTLWTYGADWYVSPVTQELRGLYTAPDKAAPLPQTP